MKKHAVIGFLGISLSMFTGVAVSKAVAPAAPANLAVLSASPANSALNQARVTVDWNSVPGALGYEVDATAAGQTTVSTVLTGLSGDNLSTSLAGLTGGVQYSFVVTSINADGKTSSSPVSFTPHSIPDVPTAVVATVGVKSANISWGTPTNTGGLSITGYKISTVEGAITPVTVSGSSTSATISNLQNGGVYTFTVAAINDLGTSTTQQAQKVTLPDVPGKPTGVSGSVTSGTVTLTWAAPVITGNSPITSYAVHVLDATNVEVGQPQTATGTTATISGLTAGSYTAKVAATNAVGTGVASDASTAFVITAKSNLSGNTPTFTPARISDLTIASTQAISATAPSNGTVNITVSPGTICTYSSVTGLITGTGAGVCTVLASVQSSSTFASGQASLNFNVVKRNQTINFNSVSPQTMPGPLSLHATASSGLNVMFTATGDCSVSGSSVTFTNSGQCSITANSPANDQYNMATPVTVTFAISAAISSGGGNSDGGTGGGGGGGYISSGNSSPVVAPVAAPTPTPSASASPTPIQSIAPTPKVSSTPMSTSSSGGASSTPKPVTVPNAATPSSSGNSKVIAPGLAVSSAKPTVDQVVAVTSKPSTTISSAPNVSLNAGSVSAPKISALPKSTPISVSITVGGKSVSLGTVKTSASGVIQLPGVNLAKAGTYVIALKDPKGVTHYVKLVVKVRKSK